MKGVCSSSDYYCGLIVCVLMVTICASGCGDGDGKFQHSDGAKFYIEAMKVRTKDEAKCLELLDKSLELLPTDSAYFHRAWIFAKRGEDDQAITNIASGLELKPENTDLHWLQAELKKPEQKRNLQAPPSKSK